MSLTCPCRMWGAIKYLGKLTGDFGADVIGRRGCYSQVTFFSLLAQVRMRDVLLGMEEVSKMSVVW